MRGLRCCRRSSSRLADGSQTGSGPVAFRFTAMEEDSLERRIIRVGVLAADVTVRGFENPRYMESLHPVEVARCASGPRTCLNPLVAKSKAYGSRCGTNLTH